MFAVIMRGIHLFRIREGDQRQKVDLDMRLNLKETEDREVLLGGYVGDVIALD